MNWPDELIAQLRSLWDEGLTTAEIARRLRLSRGAVVGKAHRLGLSARPSPIKPRDGEPKPRRIRTLTAYKNLRGWEANQRQYGWKPPPTLPALPSVTVAKPERKPVVVKLPVRPRWPHCQWAVNAERPWRFCAEACSGALPYCEEHRKLAYHAARDLRDERADDLLGQGSLFSK